MFVLQYIPYLSRLLGIGTQAATYSLETTWRGNDFYSGFTFFTADDPTHGRVNYVDEATAKAKNLTQVSGNTFYMRVDHTSTVAVSARGRDSVRLHSKNTYSDGLVVLDVQHMPVGCGTWPAFWTCTTGDWPVGGEVDIIEGVNGQGKNLVSLHTSSGCTMPSTGRNETGTQASNDCVSGNGSNQGCNVADTRASSFGASFNAYHGGYYVMRRDASRGIAVWFWPRNSTKIPSGIKKGSKSVSESSLGKPVANFPNTASCNIASHFSAHQIIFDDTLCGDWAGQVWSSSSCASKASTCEDWVNNHPNAFATAYWAINALRWYKEA